MDALRGDEGNISSNPVAIPEGYKALVALFHSYLLRIPKAPFVISLVPFYTVYSPFLFLGGGQECPLLLLIDSLDQLSDEDRGGLYAAHTTRVTLPTIFFLNANQITLAGVARSLGVGMAAPSPTTPPCGHLGAKDPLSTSCRQH